MKLLTRLFISFLAAICLTGCATSTNIDCGLQLEPLENAPALHMTYLQDVPRRNSEREDLVFRALENMGCPAERQQLPYRSSSNVICRIKGVTDDEILIAAHHDSLGSGRGIADNWTGISILLSLADHYLKNPPLHQLTFVAFADEEDDMKGSYHYVKQIRKSQAHKPRLVVNMDTLGVGNTQMGHRSSSRLGCIANAAASGLGYALGSRRVAQMAGDWEPFMRADIPTLHFHSLNEKTMRLLHTYRDRRELVDDERLVEAYEIIANTIAALDYSMDITTGIEE